MALVTLAVMLVSSVPAHPSDRPDFLPEAEQPAWNAVGRVNLAGLYRRGMCTGTLVAPDMVLTAAHCLFDRAGRMARAEDVHFIAGWRVGAVAGRGIAAELLVHPDYVPAQQPQAERIGEDIAFMRLATPIDAADVTPLPLARLPDAAGPLSILAYRQDRPHILSRHAGCGVVWRGAAAIGLDCPVIEGSSGAPVLWNGPGGWRVVALVAARAEGGGGPASLAPLVPTATLPEAEAD